MVEFIWDLLHYQILQKREYWDIWLSVLHQHRQRRKSIVHVRTVYCYTINKGKAWNWLQPKTLFWSTYNKYHGKKIFLHHIFITYSIVTNLENFATLLTPLKSWQTSKKILLQFFAFKSTKIMSHHVFSQVFNVFKLAQ